MFPVPKAGTDDNVSLCCWLETRSSLLVLKGLFVSQCPLDTINVFMFSSTSKVKCLAITSDFCNVKLAESSALFSIIFASNISFGEDSVSRTLLSSLLVGNLMWGAWLWSPASWLVESRGALPNRCSWEERTEIIITKLGMGQDQMQRAGERHFSLVIASKKVQAQNVSCLFQ